MHTKVKIFALALLITLSFISFCYLNLNSTQIEEVVSFSNTIVTEPVEFNSVLPELELIEWVIKKILPVIH